VAPLTGMAGPRLCRPGPAAAMVIQKEARIFFNACFLARLLRLVCDTAAILFRVLTSTKLLTVFGKNKKRQANRGLPFLLKKMLTCCLF
jgi:hypothetical protein